MGRLRRFWRWATTGTQPLTPRRFRHCPLCGREIVGQVESGAVIPGPGGPHVILPHERELIDHCPEHGRPPFNEPG